MADGITTLTASSFDEEIGSAAEPVLVDFWAEWCGPCKMIAPILDEIAVEQEGKLKIGKLNVDEAVMQMEYSVAKQRRAQRRIRRDNLRAWAIRRAEREARLIELAGPDAHVILMSDHGFHPDHLRRRQLPNELVPHHRVLFRC